jgi:hypothetical protein
VTSRRGAVNNDRRVAARNDGCSVTLARTGHLVADACNPNAIGIRRCGAADDSPSMAGFVTDYYEWSGHCFLALATENVEVMQMITK